MKRIFLTLFTAFLVFGLMAHEAEAKRLGGGSSSGMSRNGNVMNKQAVSPTPAASVAASTPTPAPAAPTRSPWMGMLGGLALGAGIGALLGHFGLGDGFGGILMALLVGAAVFFLIRMFMNRNQQLQPLQYAGAGPGGPMPFEPMMAGSGPVSAAIVTTGSIPAGFDAEGFVRQAKLNFVRLQAANDAGNMDDIRAFTTPEMFAEIQLEYQERGKVAQQTDVVQLNAELLDLAHEGRWQIASVRFNGSIRESASAVLEAFDEVWHLAKPESGSQGWVIAGIQQYA